MMDVTLKISPPLSNAALGELLSAAWGGPPGRDYGPILARSLAYVCAYDRERLVGFVNLAWDGGIHAFLLDTSVHPDWQRRGVGSRLVLKAAEAARKRGIVWLHVDYEPHLDGFYRACGFMSTYAGLMRLNEAP